MRRSFFFPLFIFGLFLLLCLADHSVGRSGPEGTISRASDLQLAVHAKRSSPLDLELSGDVIGLARGTMGYLTREELLSLPQVSYVVDDANFKSATQVSGVLLEELAKHLSTSPQTDLIVAHCHDKYLANYPRAYVSGFAPYWF